MKKKILVGIIVLSMIVPVFFVEAGSQNYSLRVTKRQYDDYGENIRWNIKVDAPIPYGAVRCTPPKMIKHQIWKRNVYDTKWVLKKSHWVDLYYVYKYGANHAKASDSHFNLDHGDYKSKFTMYENCYFRKKTVTHYFRVG